MDGLTGVNTATTDELRDAVAVTDPFYVVVEAGGVVDQQPPPLGQDRSARGVPTTQPTPPRSGRRSAAPPRTPLVPSPPP